MCWLRRLPLRRQDCAEPDEGSNASRKAAGTVKHIEQALQKIKCGRSLEGAVVSRDWDTFTDVDFEELSSCGYVNANYVKRDISRESGFESKFFLHVQLGQKELDRQIRKLMKDPALRYGVPDQGIFPE